jgi:VanZ family protein
MLPLPHARRWRGAGFLLLVAVFILALVPMAWILPIELSLDTRFIHGDKVLHCLTFAVLTIWFAGQYGKESYWRLGAGLVVFGMLIEISQYFVSYRSSDWFDLTADVIGIVAGLVIALSGLGGWTVWVENQLGGSRDEAGLD